MLYFMGVDPGLRNTGIGVVAWERGKLSYVDHFLVQPPTTGTLPERLRYLIDGVKTAAEKYELHSSAVENVFYSVNAKSALTLGQTRGAIIATLLQAGLVVEEFSALQIKQSVVGYGKAEKEQVKKMVELHLNRLFDKLPLDVTDGLACAICLALYQTARIR